MKAVINAKALLHPISIERKGVNMPTPVEASINYVLVLDG
jgi:hypothetical protein